MMLYSMMKLYYILTAMMTMTGPRKLQMKPFSFTSNQHLRVHTHTHTHSRTNTDTLRSQG